MTKRHRPRRPRRLTPEAAAIVEDLAPLVADLSDGFAAMRPTLPAIRASLPRVVWEGLLAGCDQCLLSSLVPGVLCLCGHDWGCHVGHHPHESCRHCRCPDMMTKEDFRGRFGDHLSQEGIDMLRFYLGESGRLQERWRAAHPDAGT